MNHENQIDNLDDDTLPDIGEELAPTNEMILEGRVGNGTWDDLTPELASRVQAERKEAGKAVKKARREGYNEGMKDALEISGRVTKGIASLGDRLLERLEGNDEMTRLELDTLKLAQSSAKEIADRGVGKAKAITEIRNETKILNLIHKREERIDPPDVIDAN